MRNMYGVSLSFFCMGCLHVYNCRVAGRCAVMINFAKTRTVCMCSSLPCSHVCNTFHLLPGLTSQEITVENAELSKQIKEYRRKVSMIRDLIEQMDRNYEASKRYIVIQRYRLLKTIIKTVIHNAWI